MFLKVSFREGLLGALPPGMGYSLFFLETGLLLYLTLWKQKLWGLMLSEEEFDQQTHK